MTKKDKFTIWRSNFKETIFIVKSVFITLCVILGLFGSLAVLMNLLYS